MKLHRAELYALKAVAFLAGQEGKTLVASEKIARGAGVPEEFLRKVLHPLVRAGVLTAMVGPNGGYRLARPAKEITVLDVVETTAGPIRGEVPPVSGQALPALEKACRDVAEAARKTLGKVKVSDLAGSPGRKGKEK